MLEIIQKLRIQTTGDKRLRNWRIMCESNRKCWRHSRRCQSNGKMEKKIIIYCKAKGK